MWEDNDKRNFRQHVMSNKGQICNDSFSKLIEQYATNESNKTFLEIGTWNGMGSTRAFANGFNTRSDDYIFYSLECNKDKHEIAKKLYEDNDKMYILNEVIWNEEPPNFYEVFPQCKTNEMYKHWNEVDIVNMKNCEIFLNRPDLPEVFDVILLDGGEFTTYFEFQKLKNRCKVIMLDDINVDKCKLIVEEIRTDTNWEVVTEDKTRNGFMVAKFLPHC